jgi:hypothetical protein
MHRPDDESTCGLEIPIGPILVSLVDRFTETGNFEMDEPVLGNISTTERSTGSKRSVACEQVRRVSIAPIRESTSVTDPHRQGERGANAAKKSRRGTTTMNAGWQ